MYGTTANGQFAIWTGAGQDLAGNSVGNPASDAVSVLNGGPLSTVLSNLQYGTNGSVPTALISAETNSANLSGLGIANPLWLAIVSYQLVCGGSPAAGSLMYNLYPPLWNSVFAYQSGSPNLFDNPGMGYQYNDAIVPLSSQLADAPLVAGLPAPVAGLIHTSSLTYLGFSGAGELDSIFVANLAIQYLKNTLPFYLNLP